MDAEKNPHQHKVFCRQQRRLARMRKLREIPIAGWGRDYRAPGKTGYRHPSEARVFEGSL